MGIFIRIRYKLRLFFIAEQWWPAATGFVKQSHNPLGFQAVKSSAHGFMSDIRQPVDLGIPQQGLRPLAYRELRVVMVGFGSNGQNWLNSVGH